MPAGACGFSRVPPGACAKWRLPARPPTGWAQAEGFREETTQARLDRPRVDEKERRPWNAAGIQCQCGTLHRYILEKYFPLSKHDTTQYDTQNQTIFYAQRGCRWGCAHVPPPRRSAIELPSAECRLAGRRTPDAGRRLPTGNGSRAAPELVDGKGAPDAARHFRHAKPRAPPPAAAAPRGRRQAHCRLTLRAKKSGGTVPRLKALSPRPDPPPPIFFCKFSFSVITPRFF